MSLDIETRHTLWIAANGVRAAAGKNELLFADYCAFIPAFERLAVDFNAVISDAFFAQRAAEARLKDMSGERGSLALPNPSPENPQMATYRGFKLTNDYANTLGDLYDATPKAVLAAVAVSALTLGGDYLETAEQRVLAEWWALYDNGIVPQKPNRPRPPKEEWEPE